MNKLGILFKVSREEKNDDTMEYLVRIIKALINLNKCELLEKLLSDEFFLTTFGILECIIIYIIYIYIFYIDDKILDWKKNDLYHVEFLERVKYNKVISVSDPDFERRIHENYRLGYLRDTAGSCWLEENIQAELQRVYIIYIYIYIYSKYSITTERFVQAYASTQSQSIK